MPEAPCSPAHGVELIRLIFKTGVRRCWKGCFWLRSGDCDTKFRRDTMDTMDDIEDVMDGAPSVDPAMLN